MTTISFVGDIMLGRFVADKYNQQQYSILDRGVLKVLEDSDFRIANLESPVVSGETDDSLRFAADSNLLEQFKWVDCFSLSNNHINDFGKDGMKETIHNLQSAGIAYNGLFDSEYEPIKINHDGDNIAIITCSDMMNYEFDVDCPYKTLRMNQAELVFDQIRKYRNKGCFVILYLHAGMLFSRYLNPIVRDFAHQAVDNGAGAIITSHSHCLGGYEIYKNALICNSLGDFVMDGSSFRRRMSCILRVSIEKGRIDSWKMFPTITTWDLQTVLPPDKEYSRMIGSISEVSDKIAKNAERYETFFKSQYKKEMIQHSISTLQFEYKRRGLVGMLKILFVRILDVFGMIKRLVTNRSKMSWDEDAVKSRSIKSIK